MKKKLSNEQIQSQIIRLSAYLETEMYISAGMLETEMLLRFCSELCYPHHYNDALFDVLRLHKDRMERLEDDLLILEKNDSVRKDPV